MNIQFFINSLDYLPIIAEKAKQGEIKIAWKFVEGYRRWRMNEASYTDIAAGLGVPFSGLDRPFKSIEGHIRELKGGMLELEMLRQYLASGQVISMTPEPILEYPAGCSPDGQPDRQIILVDSSIRFCSWKAYGGTNATLPLAHKSRRTGDYLFSPEIRAARRMIEKFEKMGGDPDRIHVVVEGTFGLDFFQIEVDPYTPDHSITISQRNRMGWPPSSKRLTGIISNGRC